MKLQSLSTKIFLTSGLILIILSLASFGILYRAQTQQAVREMDMLLESQVIALSSLVNGLPNGDFDFEMPPFFLAQYKKIKPDGFFRFMNLSGDRVIRESPNAPPVNCKNMKDGNSSSMLTDHHIFRLKTLIFRPEIDTELKNTPSFESSPICLVVGIDETPYKALIMKTLFSTIPLLITLVLILIGILLALVRRITRDLSILTRALETADFSATHEFPILPVAQTVEVKAVVEKLVGLHEQATNVYLEMWLFLGRAAHQLKTPVTAIQSTLQVLLRKERSKEELLLSLKDVESAAGLLATLTKKLISSSRISYQESPSKENIDLLTFLSEQKKMFHSLAEQYGVSLILTTSSSLTVLANPLLLSELFGNLIENAILYSPREQGAQVSISWTIEQQNAVILISDQGMGFPVQVTNALFEPFVRGDERQIPGSGLGLSIAKRSAELLGGHIRIQETSSKGSVLLVSLPMIDNK